MEKYKVGTVFELYENDPQRYLIINHYEKDQNDYLLVVPVDDTKGKVMAQYEKVMLLNIDKKTEEIEIETNKDLITEVVDKFMDSNKQG